MATKQEVVDGITWTYSIDDGEAVLENDPEAVLENDFENGFEDDEAMVKDDPENTLEDVSEGWLKNHRPAIPIETAGAIIVPSSLGGCPVTCIGDGRLMVVTPLPR